jgi:hypothetical protein
VPDWADSLSAVNKKLTRDLVEVLYNGQPVDRLDYGVVDNAHGRVPWPVEHYRAGANMAGGDEIEPPERLTVTAWEMTVVSLTDALDGGGGYGTPMEYAQRANILVV